MTNNKQIQDLEQLVEQEWDRIVSDAGGAIPVSEVREQIIPIVATRLEETDRDYEGEAKVLVTSFLTKVRDGRTTQLKRDMDFIIDYILDPEGAALFVVGLLDRAYPLGTPGGEDMALRYWRAEDIQQKINARYRNAADATAEARAFDEAATTLILAMQRQGASTIGGLVVETENLSA